MLSSTEITANNAPVDATSKRKFTAQDMKLFPLLTQDSGCFRLFLSSFLPVPGHPLPSLGADDALPVPLVIAATSSTTKETSKTEPLLLHLPKGAIERCREDKKFKAMVFGVIASR